MDYLGNFISTGVSVHHKFMTVNASGRPTTLGDSPSMVLYVNSTTSGIASGVSVTPDFDGRTGLNAVRFLVTTSVTGITSGTECQLVIATGSVSGISMNGFPVCAFGVMNRVANVNVTSLSTQVAANVTAYSTQIAANVTAASTNVGAVVTSVSTIVPARITAQGIDVGAIVTAFNTIAPANVTSISTNVGAIVTAFNTIANANVTSISTIAPARVTAQGIDVGAIVTAVSTIVPARLTAQGIDVGAIVTAINTVANANVTSISTVVNANVTSATTAVPANVTSVSASGLADFFLTDSGTTYASAVAGSPVKEIADNAGGTSLSVTGIAAGVWAAEVTVHTTAGTFGKQMGGSTVLPANVTAIAAGIITFNSFSAGAVDANALAADAVTEIQNGLATETALVSGVNVYSMASVTVIGSGSASDLWRGA